MASPPLLVSACLVGFRCRYDGTCKADPRVLRVLKERAWIAVCPEQRAGFPTPRDPIYFFGGTGKEVLKGKARIVQAGGGDVTEPLLQASRSLLEMVRAYGVREGILKEKSPSCGVSKTYLGDKLVTGMGLIAAMLVVEGITITSEKTVKTEEVGRDR